MMVTTVKMPDELHEILSKIRHELSKSAKKELTYADIIRLGLVLIQGVRSLVGDDVVVDLLEADPRSTHTLKRVAELFQTLQFVHAARRIAAILCEKAPPRNVPRLLGHDVSNVGHKCSEVIECYLREARDLQAFIRKLQIVLDDENYRPSALNRYADEVQTALNDVLAPFGLCVEKLENGKYSRWIVKKI